MYFRRRAYYVYETEIVYDVRYQMFTFFVIFIKRLHAKSSTHETGVPLT